MSFLQNPNVARSSVVQKQKFLRSKGLTETEIQIACDRAGVFTKDPSTIINMGIPHQPPVVPLRQSMQPTSLSTFQRVRDIVSSTALIAGLAYAVYMVYKVGRDKFSAKKFAQFLVILNEWKGFGLRK